MKTGMLTEVSRYKKIKNGLGRKFMGSEFSVPRLVFKTQDPRLETQFEPTTAR